MVCRYSRCTHVLWRNTFATSLHKILMGPSGGSCLIQVGRMAGTAQMVVTEKVGAFPCTEWRREERWEAAKTSTVAVGFLGMAWTPDMGIVIWEGRSFALGCTMSKLGRMGRTKCLRSEVSSFLMTTSKMAQFGEKISSLKTCSWRLPKASFELL